MGGGASGPPPPPFENVAGCWGLFNLNPVGYSMGSGVNIDGSDDHDDQAFLTFTPYPLNWDINPALGTPPYSTNTVYDQNAVTNNLAASGSARPTLDAVNKLAAFDGIANGMQGSSNLYPGNGSTVGTVYFDIAALSLAAGTRVIFETGEGTADRGVRLSITQIANVLTCSIYDTTPVVALPNTKIWTIPDTGRFFGCFQWDTSQSTPANQTALFINNSSSGVTSPASADCAGLEIGKGLPNLGARNSASSNFFNGNMWSVEAVAAFDDAAARLVQYNWNNYVHST